MTARPEYNFRKVSVLIAEDGEYVRSMLSSTLKNMGVGNVVTLEDGGAAIDYLTEGNKGGLGASSPVDVIIADWEMEPVDGLMLLRWVRRHADSPNRFIPFGDQSGYP